MTSRHAVVRGAADRGTAAHGRTLNQDLRPTQLDEPPLRPRPTARWAGMTSRAVPELHPSALTHRCEQIDLPAPVITEIPAGRDDLTPDYRIAAVLRARGITASVTGLGRSGTMSIRLDSENAARVAEILELGGRDGENLRLPRK